MTNLLLDQELINLYDYSKMTKEVKKIFSTLNLMKIKYDHVALPIITPSYEIKYSSKTNNFKSKLEDYIIKKISREEDLNKYIDKIASALKKLNQEELIVFSETFITRTDDDTIGYKIGSCKDNVIRTRKSAVIKFLVSLGEDERFVV